MARKSIADMIEDESAVPVPAPPGLAGHPLPAPATEPPAAVGPTGPDAVPAPPEAAGTGDLTDSERADLTACEIALDGLRLAFWAAGKALQVIRDGRLYRETHSTFEAYAQDRWDMTRRQADRLIAAWPLAERLRPIGLTTLNEGQIRELAPVADRHGIDAAVTVYRTVAETDGVKVTAAVLKGAVTVISGDRFDPAEAAEQIRAYLAGQLDTGVRAAVADPAQAFTVEAERLRAVVGRTIRRPEFLNYARAHPDQARAVVAELRSLLDEIEAETQDQA